MIPRLGQKFPIEIETVSKPNEAFRTEEYARSGLPLAPAIMIADELIMQGCDIDEAKVEAAICRRLGLPEPELQKKGIFDRFLGT